MPQEALHLFIDTNVLLSFYAFSNDDLEQLRKLVALTKNGNLVLYTTIQVQDEFSRNREVKLSESVRQFERAVMNFGIPRFMEGYEEIKTFEESAKTLAKARDALVVRAKKEAEERSLAADVLVAEIMASLQPFKPTDALMIAAHRRMLRGNPPGKSGKIGDQLNWELLLANVPNGKELHIVSKDGDFESPLNTRPLQFLIDEWKARKAGTLCLHNELKPFLTSKFPHIKFAVDVDKQNKIDALVYSGNFQATHAAISQLYPYIDAFTRDDVVRLAEAAAQNSQINWITSDEDVYNFYRKILPPHFKHLSPEYQVELDDSFHITKPKPPLEAPDDLPF
jgi:predicted nucleic acid-binding protein